MVEFWMKLWRISAIFATMFDVTKNSFADTGVCGNFALYHHALKLNYLYAIDSLKQNCAILSAFVLEISLHNTKPFIWYAKCKTGFSNLNPLPLPIPYSAEISTMMYDMTEWWMGFWNSLAYSMIALALHLEIVSPNSLNPGRCCCNFEWEILKLTLIFILSYLSTSGEITLRWMPLGPIGNKAMQCR